MRIISGSARGTRLAEFSGKQIRPTSDRVRGAVFSIITSLTGNLHNIKVLDIFAGSGAMGLEALSRGAAQATFIDLAPQAVKLIGHNCERCRLYDRARIKRGDVHSVLPLLQGNSFDLIFIDPPYGQELLPAVLKLISDNKLLTADGIIYAEEGKQQLVPTEIAGFTQLKNRNYGGTSIYIFTHYPVDNKP